MTLDISEEAEKEVKEHQGDNTARRGLKKRPSLKLLIDDNTGPKNRPSLYELISMKIRAPSHSAVSPSQKSDTSADSSDSSSDTIPAKVSRQTPTTPPTSRNPLRLLPLKSPCSPSEPCPQPRIETILSPGLPDIVTRLLTNYGLPVHAGFIDPSFSIYLPPSSSPDTHEPDCAVSFKPSHGVAVIYGDPLCAPDRVGEVFDSFCAYAKRRKWRVAVIAATSRLQEHAVKQLGWGAFEFAVESVLNPTTNVIEKGKGFQTIRRDNRKLSSTGWKVELYDPSKGRSLELEVELSKLYNSWREERNALGVPQTYSTVLDPWLVPGACRHLYVRSPETQELVGLATLIRCGGVDGYLLDPLLKTKAATRGVTEYLTTHALNMLRDEGGKHLTFGFASLTSFHTIMNVPAIVEKPARVVYAKLQHSLSLSGKITWHDKWKPERKNSLWLLFPPVGISGFIVITRALTGLTHIRLRDVVTKIAAGDGKKGKQTGEEGGQENGKKGKQNGEEGGQEKDRDGQTGGEKSGVEKTGREREPEVVGGKESWNSWIRWPTPPSCLGNWPGRKLTGIATRKKLSGIPSSVQNGIPNGSYNGVPNGIPSIQIMSKVPNGIENGIPNGIQNGSHHPVVPNGIQNGSHHPVVPNGIQNGSHHPVVPNGIQNGSHHPVVPNGIKNGSHHPVLPNGIQNGSHYPVPPLES